MITFASPFIFVYFLKKKAIKYWYIFPFKPHISSDLPSISFPFWTFCLNLTFLLISPSARCVWASVWYALVCCEPCRNLTTLLIHTQLMPRIFLCVCTRARAALCQSFISWGLCRDLSEGLKTLRSEVMGRSFAHTQVDSMTQSGVWSDWQI